MKLKLMGRKKGMTQIFSETGGIVPCTVLHVEPNVVTQLKTEATDGYNAVQLAYDKVEVKDPRTIEKRVRKPLRGHFKKAGVEPYRYLKESRVDDVESYEVGQEFNVAAFGETTFVDVTAISKGKGYQGVMKLHGFSGGPAAHGSGFHRHAGSTGMRSTPGRCLPGGKRASQMGNKQVTVQSLEVVLIDAEEDLILVKGAVPGPQGAVVAISAAKKKPAKK